MNSKERVLRAFHFEKPDRIPMSCMSIKTDFFPISQFPPRTWQPYNYPPHVPGGVNSSAKFFYRKIMYDWNKKIRNNAIYKKKWWQNPHIGVDEWGVLWKSSGTKGDDLTKGHPYKGPLQENWDDLNDYKIPDAGNVERYRLIRSKLWKFLGKKRYTVGDMGVNGFFNLCSQIRGFNNLLIDFAKHPKEVESLIKKILPFYIIQINQFKKFYPTLNSIMVADDLGTQHSPFISPKIFNKFFSVPYKKLISITHDLGMDLILHSCGQILELMPDIINFELDVFEFDSPLMTGVENFKELVEQRKVAFWLSSNIQSTYILGKPKEIEEEIKYYIKNLGNHEGGLAIYEYTSNKVLRTPKENIIAQRNAVLKWGKYNEKGIIEWLA